MNRNEVSREEIIQRLSAALGHRPECGNCGHKRLTMDVVKLNPQPPNLPLGASIIGGPFLPFVALTCMRCGHSDLYNLVILGIVPNSEGVFVQPDMPPKGENDARRIIDEALGPEDRPMQH